MNIAFVPRGRPPELSLRKKFAVFLDWQRSGMLLPGARGPASFRRAFGSWQSS